MKRSRTFEWDDPRATTSAAEGRTGLELLRSIVAGETPQPPISAPLDFAIVGASEGAATFRGVPGEHLLNPMGVIHGGYAATLLDSAMGCAVMTTLDADTAYTTVELSIHLTRAIRVDAGPIVAEGKIVHRGARVATAEGRLVDGQGRLLAHGTTTCVVMPRRSASGN
jgi:uncharacterized protein (TIGR00369 family)